MTENTEEIQGGRFQKGQSGNPAGKPKGARHKTTLAIQALLDGEAENITRKAIEAAMAGDMAAIRLVMERVLPARKDSPVSLELSSIANIDNAVELMQAVLSAVSHGDITPLEANSLTGIIEQWRKTYETKELADRLALLEETIKKGGKK
jgi:hypothetical protein